MDEAPTFPAMTMKDAQALLTGPDTPFEMETVTIRGIETRSYKGTPTNLLEIFDASAVHDDRTFIVYEDERLTFGQHRKAVHKLSHELQTRFGVKKGDRVALIMRNYPEWSITFWATVNIGAVIVPLNAWGTGTELEYGILDSGSKVVVVDAERLDILTPHLEALGLRGLIAVRAPELPSTAYDFEDLVCARDAYDALVLTDFRRETIEPEDDVTIFYTSGTTGLPKGALGTHRNIATNLMNTGFVRFRAMLRRGETPEPPDPEAPQKGSLISVPLFHATGCHSILVPTLASGGKLVLMHKWNPERALELIEAEKLNSFGGVPAMVWQVLESPRFGEHDLSSVEAIGYGGAPSAPELVERMKQEFPDVASSNGYGLTETSSITTSNVAEDYRLRPESAGVAVATCDLRVVDENGKDVQSGEVGELWIKGPNVVKGYWNKPEATAESFTDGWLHSGDLVRIDEEGFVFILDRAKDMLIRGGENIYCVEVEDALYAHPAIMDAAVVGIPHKILGEEVGAVVQIAPGHDVSDAELMAFVGERLAKFKVPIKIEMRGEPLPRNANGKILKKDLREVFAP
jgi:steroid-24-oyl-CoA synthetase